MSSGEKPQAIMERLRTLVQSQVVDVLKELAAWLKRPEVKLPVDNAGRGEAIANVMLALRHAEDARMRMGKVNQALDGGVSILDRPDGLRERALRIEDESRYMPPEVEGAIKAVADQAPWNEHRPVFEFNEKPAPGFAEVFTAIMKDAIKGLAAHGEEARVASLTQLLEGFEEEISSHDVEAIGAVSGCHSDLPNSMTFLDLDTAVGPKITPEDIELVLGQTVSEVRKMGNKTTVMCSVLPSGFEIVTSSGCVDPANYDEELGTRLCTNKLRDQLWFLLGFMLQNMRAMANENEAAAIARSAPSSSAPAETAGE